MFPAGKTLHDLLSDAGGHELLQRVAEKVHVLSI